jgi:arylformamidase
MRGFIEGEDRNQATIFSRRALFKLAGAMSSLAMSGLARPVTAETQANDEAVWRSMSQRELDAAYDQSVYAANLDQVLRRYSSNSKAVRDRIGEPERFAYGDSAIEKVDVYLSLANRAPIHIFIHGGAWQSGFSRDYAFAAELFVNAGVHLVVPDFTNVRDTNGNLFPLVKHIRNAIAWVYRNAAAFGGDPERIYISGHSSGGHLAAVALTTDWQADFSLPNNIIKGGLIISGMFDLYPVSLSSRSGYVNFTDETLQQLSPQRNLDKLNTPIILAYGTEESPEFIRQSVEFAERATAAEKSIQVFVGENYNHFEILETLANPYGLLGREVLRQMAIE